MYKWYKDINQNFVQEVIPCNDEWEKIRSSSPVNIFRVGVSILLMMVTTFVQ